MRRRDPAPAYLGSFVVIGLSTSVVGPALSSLQRHAGVSLRAVSSIFVAQSIGYVLGTLSSGRLIDRSLGHRLYATALLVGAAAFLALPSASSLVGLWAVFAVVGMAGGAVDAAGNTFVMWSRSGNVGSLMSALHLSFGVGALLCPILIDRSQVWRGDISVACWVIATLATTTAVFVLTRTAPVHPQHGADEPVAPAATGDLAAVAFFFVLYVGLETGFGGWVHTYAERIHLGGAGAAAALTTTFWASFTLGRLASVGVARRVRPGHLLFASTALAVCAAGVLMTGSSPVITYVGTVLMGLGTAPQFPCMMAFAEEHLNITGTATGWFIGASGIGGLALPWLTGQFFASVGPTAVPKLALVMSIATLGWLVVLNRRLRDAHPSAAPMATSVA